MAAGERMEQRKLEILAPAGSYEGFQAAMKAGADAVYAGGSLFGARAYADNFTEDELCRALDEAHCLDRKIYLAVNTLLKEEELPLLTGYLGPYYERGLDGVIIQDIGVFLTVREAFPDLPIHCSTQMTLTGAGGALLMENLGASRIVTARELSLGEIRQIREKTSLELECFVHGAMCFSYSGQCLMSSLIGGRSGNRGRCAQPCRLPCRLMEEGGKAVFNGGDYLMSLKDLCALHLIPALAEAGVDSFKIEGRMKRPEYAYGVTRLYRRYADLYLERGTEGFRVREEDKKQLLDLYTRGESCTGYLECHNGRTMLTLDSPGYRSDHEESFALVRLGMQKAGPAVPISGVFEMEPGRPLSLTVSCGGDTVCVQGVTAQKAVSRSVKEEEIRRQLLKTGGTPFLFDTLSVRIQGECFVPLKSLNELRRQALDLLRERRLSPYIRRIPSRAVESTGGQAEREPEERAANGSYPLRPANHSAGPLTELSLGALVLTEEQLDAMIEADGVDRIYAEAPVFSPGSSREAALAGRLADASRRAHDAGKSLMLALPHVFRERTCKRYERMAQEIRKSGCDGFLVRNYEELHWIKAMGFSMEWAADAGLYTYNSAASRFFLAQGAAWDTAPYELRYREYLMRGCGDSELTVYGYLPMMTTAQCFAKLAGGCLAKSGGKDPGEESREPRYILRDRMKKEFPVRRFCNAYEDCYNVVYNSLPLSLHGEWERVQKLKPRSARLIFTVENGDRAAEIARFYAALCRGERQDYDPVGPCTRGLFKRGAE